MSEHAPVTTPALAAEPSGPTASRRQVLVTGGVVVAAAAVTAACGSSGSTTSTASTPAAAGSSPVAGGGGATLSTSEVPVGGGTILADRKIVVTQPQAGEFKAFTAVCTHRGCTVAQVSNGLIRCPCHGSTYSITDGSVQGGPAPAPLASIPVTVSGTSITVA